MSHQQFQQSEQGTGVQTIVARRYKFNATHHIPELNPPWSEPHDHEYTVEVVASTDPEAILDTDNLDEVWDQIGRLEGRDLNDVFQSTTVEYLAAHMLESFRDTVGQDVFQVTVWEDDSRWGRATA